MEYEFNECQSSLEELKIYDQPKEVQEQFFDFLNNVPFIRWMVSKDRPHAKDLPRDDKGRIIFDIIHPPILDDMDYFRPSAIQFKKDECYCNLRPNPNPNSEFKKFWDKELDRCWNGMVRESDGMWIPGDMYFYLNYNPIIQSRTKEGSKKAERVVDFPECWDGVLFRYFYILQAQEGGLYNKNGGLHGCEISSRGKSKSYSTESMMVKRFVIGESREVSKDVKCMVTAYQKQFLTSDGILNKFQRGIDFMAMYTPFPNKRLKSSLQDMSWTMGYMDLNTGTRRGTLNEVVGVSAKDDIGKVRGKRQNLIIVEEFGCHIKGTEVLMADGTVEKVENVKIGDFLMGDDGTPRKVLKTHNGVDKLYKITLSNGDSQIVNSKHLIYYKRYNWNSGKYKELLQTPEEVMNYKSLDKGNYIIKATEIRYLHKDVDIDPYWIGLWLGDGSSSEASISNEDTEVIEWLKNYAKTIGLETSMYRLKQSKKCYDIYTKGTLSNGKTFRKILSELNLINNKHVPNCYKYNDEQSMLKLIAGLIDTDGTCNKKKRYYEITQKYVRKGILEDVKFMCDSLGFKTSLTTRISSPNSKGPNTLHYRLRISGDVEKIPVKIERKKVGEPSGYRNRRNWNEYTFKVEPYGIGEYYGFTIDGNNLFVLKDFTIVHNSFANVLEMYNIMRPSVEEGDYAFGQMYLIGTSGEDESDFAGAQEIVYNPNGYRMYALPNTYDKEGQGRNLITYFYPGYLSRKGCYDKNGNSNVTKALLEILLNRYVVKYNSTDLNSLTRVIAETPITPQEAITRTRGNFFPVTMLNERLNELDNNPASFDDVYVGNLIQKKDGKIEFVPSAEMPIRNYPTKDNKVRGAIEIYEMPQKDNKGVVFPNRYILGHDPVDQDTADTLSLTSTFVLDMWTDKIVAEYTGRQAYADENFEIVRLLCLFYNGKCLYENNKRGIFAYFSSRRCLHLLADTPDYLVDKQLIKVRGYGNSSKGVSATKPINDYANTLIREWLIKPVTIQVSEDNETVEKVVPNLAFIKNRALLQELIQFDDKNNFDRVRALGMLMLYRGQYVDLFEGDLSRSSNAKEEVEEDSYFKKYDEMKKFYNG